MATLKDIADICNVNISTVSRALAGKSTVNPKTRDNIRNVAEQLKYTPNLPARALAGGTTKTIGLIVLEVDSNYYAKIIKSVEQELHNHGYVLIVGIGNFEYQKELDCLKAFNSRHVDGIIMVGPFSEEFNTNLPNMREMFLQPSVIVQANTQCDFATHITMDDRTGIFAAVKHLIDLGHKRLGYISERNSKTRRINGFTEALTAYGLEYIPEYVKIGKGRFETGGYEAMNEMLDQGTRPTAVFFSCDNIALGATKAIYEHGLSIPRDISLVGYDGVKEAAYLPAALTTVVQPVAEMSRLAVQQIVSQIESNDRTANLRLSVQPQLVVRESSAPPAEA
ncbi:MAG TPA: LacI family DNA-binding transcriptional regulator [Clostridia bacterium]|nr:LacI family DNA-binding transcriptional regulator [Clostridia bacterium]